MFYFQIISGIEFIQVSVEFYGSLIILIGSPCSRILLMGYEIIFGRYE
jgi:hypothetical protein